MQVRKSTFVNAGSDLLPGPPKKYILKKERQRRGATEKWLGEEVEGSKREWGA